MKRFFVLFFAVFSSYSLCVAQEYLALVKAFGKPTPIIKSSIKTTLSSFSRCELAFYKISNYNWQYNSHRYQYQNNKNIPHSYILPEYNDRCFEDLVSGAKNIKDTFDFICLMDSLLSNNAQGTPCKLQYQSNYTRSINIDSKKKYTIQTNINLSFKKDTLLLLNKHQNSFQTINKNIPNETRFTNCHNGTHFH